jgi:ectoine hydroxylase
LLPLLTCRKAFPLVAELMGPNIQMNTTHAMVRPPQPSDTPTTYKRIDWHRDGASDVAPVHGTLPWLYTKIGFFLTDLGSPGMGVLRVVPGSHKRAERPLAEPDAVDPNGAVEVATNAGDAVYFQQRLWHSVSPNTSAVTRKNIYVGYCYRWLKPLDYFEPDPRLLERASPLERQLLGERGSEMTFWLPKDEELPLKAWLAAHRAAAPQIS